MPLKYPKVCGYTLVKEIGGGGFSTVFRACHFDDHRIAACKVLYITENTTEKEKKNWEKEMRVHAALKHENVLEYINAVVVDLKHGKTYYPGMYILLELAAGGDLFDKIAPDKGVSDDLAHFYFTQLLSGISYIHSQGVCHRDLKPENLLLSITGVLKISDFGLSAVYKLKDTGKTRTLSERCGSLPYVAPELAREGPYKGEPVDVWGCGVILYTMCVGNTPWDEPTGRSPEFGRYVEGRIWGEEPWCRIGEVALDLIKSMLTPDPAQRLTLRDVQAHPWCTRPSQLQRASPVELADRLTQELRESGDLAIAAPSAWGGDGGEDSMDTSSDDTPYAEEQDADAPMLTATHASQFTQSLLLFSQTQGGVNRYIGKLTRFYASLRPERFVWVVKEALEGVGVRVKVAQVAGQVGGSSSSSGYDGTSSEGGSAEEHGKENPKENEKARLRIGGYDHRKIMFKGWVDVEYFRKGAFEGSFVVFSRDEGDPMSWRRMWKEVVKSEGVRGWVMWK